MKGKTVGAITIFLILLVGYVVVTEFKTQTETLPTGVEWEIRGLDLFWILLSFIIMDLFIIIIHFIQLTDRGL